MTAAQGTFALLRFMLRRERIGLSIWIVTGSLLVAVQSQQSGSSYGIPGRLEKLRTTADGNAALLASQGPLRLLESVGGEVVFEVFAYIAVVAALMAMFVVIRQTRSDEEAGRAELVRSAVVGRHAPMAAALLLAVLAEGGLALGVFVAAAGTGLPPGGSALFGAAAAAVGLVFAGLSAVAAQLFTSARSAYGAVVAVVVVAFVLRAAGDVGNGAASWASPIGWGQRTYPYAGDRWWPLALAVAATAAAVLVAVVVLDRRDLGSGVLPDRRGRDRASWALRGPLGLVWRLQRGSLLTWGAGVVLLSLVYGSFGTSIEGFVRDNPDIAPFLSGGGHSVLDSYFRVTLGLGAILSTACAVSTVLRARGEEAAGRVESLLGTVTSRPAWLGGHVTVAVAGAAALLTVSGLATAVGYGGATGDPTQVPRLVGMSLVFLPGVCVVIGVATLGYGVVARAAPPLAWTAVAYTAVVMMLGNSLHLPGWVRAVSPFDHTPSSPLGVLDWLRLLVLMGLAVALAAAGFVGFRRRDVGSA